MRRTVGPWLLIGLLTACGTGSGGSSGGGGDGSGGGGGSTTGGGPPSPPVEPPPPAGPLDVSNLIASPGPTRGSVVLRFTAPKGTGGQPVDAYVVRASVPHVATAADLAGAAVMPQTYAPQAPGTLETMTLAGLDPGQTLQFCVQAVRRGVVGPFSYAVASRVTEGASPLPPANAIPVSGPGALTQPGAYYLLTRDVSAPGTAFEIQAKNVTLDLGGHTVTFGTGPGTCHGVHAQYLSKDGLTVVENGTIVQGNGGGSACNSVFLDEMFDVRVSHLDVTAEGPDANGIAVWYAGGRLRVDHCAVHLTTTVVTDRHAGVSAIDLGSSGSAEVDHNRITASPQWGIRLVGTTSTGPSFVHHNRITGTKALVANGYMIGVHMPDVDVFENDCQGESRGVHLDPRSSTAGGPGARIHDNRLFVQDQRNPEYPDFHWVHGIKVEMSSRSKVHHNLVVGVADDQHAEVRALDVDGDDAGVAATGVEIRHNRFVAIARTATYEGVAFQWTSGTAKAGNDIVVRHNVFTATDLLIRHDDAGLFGGLTRDNAFVRNLTLGAGHPFSFEGFSTNAPTSSNRLLDPITSESLAAVDQATGNPPYDATREWTLTVVAVDGAGNPVPGASVAVRDATGALAFSGTTDANGRAAGAAVESVLANGPAFTDRTPHAVTVSKAGVGSYAGPVTVKARTALRVDLAKGTASTDAAPPSAPDGVTSHALSASRALLRWSPSTDESGIAAYLVTLDGELVGVTDETEFAFFALDAQSKHTPSVQAIDAGGNRSPVAPGPSFTTLPDDRGP